jgi:hypothetical protein
MYCIKKLQECQYFWIVDLKILHLSASLLIFLLYCIYVAVDLMASEKVLVFPPLLDT